MATAIPMPPECTREVVSAASIHSRVQELGSEIRSRHPDDLIRLVTVLRGGIFFLADLCRAISGDVTMDFLAVSPYAPGNQGVVRVTKDLDDGIEDAVVILVEDVVDTGLTVNYILSFLRSHGPRSLELCTLLDKPARRIAQVPIDYTGFTLSGEFLVGYGLDLRGRCRNLPYVAEVDSEIVYG